MSFGLADAIQIRSCGFVLYGAQAVAMVKQGFREANSLVLLAVTQLFHALSSAKGRVEGDATLKVFLYLGTDGLLRLE